MNITVFRSNHFVTVSILAVFLSFLSGCVKNEYANGYSFDEAQLVKLVDEKSGKGRVKSLLGSPSSRSDFGEETWYYIHRQYENIAFFEKELVSQDIIAVRFDESDRVVSIKQYNEQNAREIAVADDITPTEGHDLNIIEQLLGNLGRFNSNRDVLDTHQ